MTQCCRGRTRVVRMLRVGVGSGQHGWMGLRLEARKLPVASAHRQITCQLPANHHGLNHCTATTSALARGQSHATDSIVGQGPRPIQSNRCLSEDARASVWRCARQTQRRRKSCRRPCCPSRARLSGSFPGVASSSSRSVVAPWVLLHIFLVLAMGN